MLDYDFMRNAFAASGIVALVAGIVGYFLVLRAQTFAGHALAHVGFTGATGAVLLGWPPLAGIVGFTLLAGVGMGALGEKLSGRDVAIGTVLALSLGTGMLFTRFFSSYAGQVTALLFGNVLGVDHRTLLALVALAVVTLLALAFISRPLLFATLQPELAEAKGVSLRGVGMCFLGIVGLATALATQIVGVLLIFTLMVGPAATAQLLTPRLSKGIVSGALIAIFSAWAGITLAYYTDWPSSFWITAISSACYLGAVVYARRRARFVGASAAPDTHDAVHHEHHGHHHDGHDHVH